MRIKRIRPFQLLFVLILIISSINLFSQTVPFTLPSPRNEALGGPHAALTDQFTTIFNNPAGFRGVESDITVADINARITGPVSSLMLAVQNGDLMELLGELGSSKIGLELGFPFTFGKIKNNMAWAAFNRINTEIFIPNLTQDALIYAGIDMGGAYGYSFGLNFLETDNELNFGFLAKLFYRTEMSVSRSFTDIMASFDDLSSLVVVEELPFDMGFGVGIDLGMKYIWRDTLSFAFVVRDIYTPLFMFRYSAITDLVEGGSPAFEYSSLPQDYSIGVMYTPEFSLYKGLFNNFKVLFDYNNIFDFALDPENAKHILLHFGLGVEFTVFDILALRLGLYEGLPSFGAGLDLHVFKLNLAMFGRELSTQPGLMSVYNLMMGFEFSY